MKPGIKVFAPASVSNVAVGFDVLGFAFDGAGDEVIIREGSSPGLSITAIRGTKIKLPTSLEMNTAGYAAQSLLKSLGEENRSLEMEIYKKMPIGSGIGSSAASAVAGVFGVSEFIKSGLTKSELLRFATEGEQLADGVFHADNVAPSLLGGMILMRNNEQLDFKKIHIPSGLCVVVLYPHIFISTFESRQILQKEVPLDKVIAQQGNLAGFIAAMYTGDFELMKRSLHDVIIEPQRAHLIPSFYEMKESALKLGAIGFSISGAGPSMFALCDNTFIAREIGEKGAALYKKIGIECDVFVSGIQQEGAVRL
ncbi:MAG: homoserine kinase [Saprospiraceae bacterium]